MGYHKQLRAKIMPLDKIKLLMSGWKSAGEEVVFTNGCFDLLHAGHADYLARARDLGQRLVIGLNTDASVRRIKGEGRPVQDQNSRALLLASFAFVDAVVFFDEDTPYRLISDLIPDILVKGSDYSPEDIVGADIVIRNGGRVETLDFIDGYSTTAIINKILKNH